MGALDGKVAVITGSTSGIGARTAELFVEEGAKVVIAGRRQADGEGLAKQLGSAAVFHRTDVTSEADIKALIEQALVKLGRIDCLFNNAGNPATSRTLSGARTGPWAVTSGFRPRVHTR
jgi:NADP-dependent 3-hydroxy acid dehydrogenase YdfG